MYLLFLEITRTSGKEELIAYFPFTTIWRKETSVCVGNEVSKARLQCWYTDGS
jgi:hypothetical protein